MPPSGAIVKVITPAPQATIFCEKRAPITNPINEVSSKTSIISGLFFISLYIISTNSSNGTLSICPTALPIFISEINLTFLILLFIAKSKYSSNLLIFPL